MGHALQILFLGLCCFIGAGDATRTLIVLNVSGGENVHGHHVLPHHAVIHVVRPQDIREQDWCAMPCVDFPLDGETLTLEGIGSTFWTVEPTFKRLMPSLETECPELTQIKPINTLKSSAAANMTLTAGSICAHRDGKSGAISAVYTVGALGDTVTIVGTKNGKSRRIVLSPDAIVEIRNEPDREDPRPNHFIAYYKQLAANDACCTNLPFGQPTESGCDLPDPSEVSTVACSNSNYP